MNLLLFERATALRAMFCLNLFQEQHAPDSSSSHETIDSGVVVRVPTAADPPAQERPPSQQVARILRTSSARPTPIPATAPAAATNTVRFSYNNNDIDSLFQDNDTVFGDILRGTRPARILGETKHVLAFQDLHPKARFHALVIPKRFIPSVFDLKPKHDDDHDATTSTVNDDLILLQEMESMAMSLLEKYEPHALLSGTATSANADNADYILCFHVPPFNSVDHLHLHVLAPKCKMSWFHAWVKYKVHTRWCTSLASVKRRLAAGQPAVPFASHEEGK